MSELGERLEAALGERYRFVRELGRGGMGIVFLAHDLRHDRPVAIKVLQSDLAQQLGRERFLREIAVAARLAHPNILPLYDSGEAAGQLFYVMPFVEGESLRDRLDRERQLPLGETLTIAREVADALSYAHSKGFLHRDIKPGNILLQEGHAVVTDFGLVRALGEAGGTRLTATGLAVGTPAYMSPEQVGGAALLDPRTDVYSLGCVVYEMLAGEPPHLGATPQAIFARQALEAPRSLRIVRDSVSPALEAAIGKALAKLPGDRYSTASEFATALELARAPARGPQSSPEVDPSAPTMAFPSRTLPRAPRRPRSRSEVLAALALGMVLVAAGAWWIQSRLRGAAGGRIESLAVLPFANLSGDPQQEYLAAGMLDSLIGELSRLRPLRVISRTSAMRYRDTTKSVPEIARELRVDAVVEGSLVRAGDSLRCSVQLIRAAPEERSLWGETFERSLPDVQTLQLEIVRALARAARIELGPEETQRLARGRRVDPEAYELYLRGMHELNRFTAAGFEKGLALLHQAIEADPASAQAYAGLATGYSLIGHATIPDAFARAKAAASRALELDPAQADAQATLAEILLYRDWDPTGALAAFERALDLGPGLARAHAHYAWTLLLFDRDDAAIAEMKRARELDPLEPIYSAWLGSIYRAARRPDLAIVEANRALELKPDFPWGLRVLGAAYADLGQFEPAIAAHRRAAEASENLRWPLGVTLAEAGRAEEARGVAAELAEEPTPLDTWGLALIYATLGDREAAFRWLDAGVGLRFSYLPWIAKTPELDPLRSDPRFAELARRVNVPRSGR